MDIFLTGGAGYIGSVCTEQLLDAGHRVTVYDNLSEGHRSAVDRRARFIHGQPEEPGDILRAMESAKPEAVLHFAAFALVGESMHNPARYFHNNVALGLRFLDAAVACGAKKFIFSSTCATYGPPDRVPITEDVPTRPISPYGESKLILEKMLGWYHQIHGLQPVIFRYFNAAGATEKLGEHHRNESHLIPRVLQVALGQHSHCEIFGTDYPTSDGTCIRDYIHVSDLAQAHMLALAPTAGGVYNLGNGGGYSVREVISACQSISGKPIRVVEKPRRAGDPPRLVAAADRARNELGWQPRFPKIEDIVTSAWRWHERNPQGYPD